MNTKRIKELAALTDGELARKLLIQEFGNDSETHWGNNANAILVCTSFAPVTRKPSLTEAVSRFATAIMSRPSRKGRNTKFLILLTATVSPMN